MCAFRVATHIVAWECLVLQASRTASTFAAKLAAPNEFGMQHTTGHCIAGKAVAKTGCPVRLTPVLAAWSMVNREATSGSQQCWQCTRGCAHQATPDLASNANVCMKHTNMETSAMPWRDV